MDSSDKMNDQPQGEWTWQTIERLYGCALNPPACLKVSDAHNAALADAVSTSREADIKKFLPMVKAEIAAHKQPQEWTVNMVQGYLIDSSHTYSDALQRLTAAINAALAAERQRSKELREDCEHYSEQCDEFERQLAALTDGTTNRGRLRDAEK